MTKFVHVELNTSDPKGAKKFYGGLFNWKYQDMSMGDGQVYTMVSTEDGGTAGIAPQAMPESPSAWLNYAEVNSIDKSIEKAKKLGGQCTVPKQVVPGMGEFAVLADPTGAMIGIWKSAAKPPAKKKTAKKAAAKKRSAGKKASKKRTAKKRTAKTAGATKRSAGKKASKKTTKKRTAKKRTAKKQTAKKAPKRRPAKKTARRAKTARRKK